jgi:hypothetical protein
VENKKESQPKKPNVNDRRPKLRQKNAKSVRKPKRQNV